jgi:hypothetical protein
MDLVQCSKELIENPRLDEMISGRKMSSPPGSLVCKWRVGHFGEQCCEQNDQAGGAEVHFGGNHERRSHPVAAAGGRARAGLARQRNHLWRGASVRPLNLVWNLLQIGFQINARPKAGDVTPPQLVSNRRSYYNAAAAPVSRFAMRKFKLIRIQFLCTN